MQKHYVKYRHDAHISRILNHAFGHAPSSQEQMIACRILHTLGLAKLEVRLSETHLNCVYGATPTLTDLSKVGVRQDAELLSISGEVASKAK